MTDVELEKEFNHTWLAMSAILIVVVIFFLVLLIVPPAHAATLCPDTLNVNVLIVDTVRAPVLFNLAYLDGGYLVDAGNGKVCLRLELKDPTGATSSTHNIIFDAVAIRDSLRNNRVLAISFKTPVTGPLWINQNSTGWSELLNGLDTLRHR